MLITSGSYKVKGKEIWDFDNLMLNTGWPPNMVLLNTGWPPNMVLLNTGSTSKLAYLCYLVDCMFTNNLLHANDFS